VCTSVGILERGRLLVCGPIGEIADRLEVQRAAAAAGAEATAAVSSPAPFSPPAAAPAPALPEPVPAEAMAFTAGGAAIPDATRKRLRLRVLGDARAVVPLLAGGSGVLGIEPGPSGQLAVYYMGNERFVADVVRHLVLHGVGIVGVEPERNELERIFLEVTKGDLQ
jgi:ABC-2 type transport system ATP-binding protein